MGFPGAIRISLGTPEENNKLLPPLTHCLHAASK